MRRPVSNFLSRSHVIWFVLLFMMLVDGWKPPPRQKKYPVCRTPECSKRGTYYFINMDTSVHPCTDFYRFACGHWSLKRPRPIYALQWTVDDELNIQALSNLRDFLSRPATVPESNDEVKARKLYHMCMSRNAVPKGNMRFVMNHIRSVFKNNQDRPVWDVHDEFLRLTGESPFFNVAYKSESNNIPILQFKEIDSPYGSIYHVADWKPAEERIYAEFLGELFQVLNSMKISPSKQQESKQLLQKVNEFRQQLNLIAKKNADKPATDWSPATVAELRKWYNKITYASDNTQIHWSKIVKILYPNLSDNDMNTKSIVTLRRKEYFIALAPLLLHTSRQVLLTHMQLYFMERHLIYSKEMRMKLESIFSGTKYIGRVRDDVPRWMVCLEEHSMELQLAKIYVKNFFPTIDSRYLQSIIEDMRNMLKEDIKKSWLRDNVKKETAGTVKSLKSAVGFPTWNMHSDDKISIAEALPMKPNAFYDPDNNRMYLAAAALTSPMYESDLPLLINIAGIGSVIAHELYHMFGNCGLYTVEGTNQTKIWWPIHDRNVCESKKQCFVDEYNLYVKRDFLGYIDHNEIDSRKTFHEDVADVMGLRLAYRYHKRKLKERPESCQVLPGFEDFTCDQLFFIAYANTMCGEISPDYVSASYTTANHNPRNLRVNGALRNHKHFGEVFGCRPKTSMNPTKKCSLWE